MKYIRIIISLAFVSVTLASCSDFLETPAGTEKEDSEVYSSEQHTEYRLNNAYGQLTTSTLYGSSLIYTFATNSDIEYIGEDKRATAADNNGYMNYLHSESAKGWNGITNLWNAIYAEIEECNDIIDGINKYGAPDKNINMSRMRAQAVVIRAMMYMEVTRIFGDVPCMMNAAAADLSNVYTEKTDRDYILDLNLAALRQAIQDLDGVANDKRHIGKYYAESLFAQIALQRCGYAIREAHRNQPYCEKGYDGYEDAKDCGVSSQSLSDATYPTLRCDQSTRNALYLEAIGYLSDVITNGGYTLHTTQQFQGSKSAFDDYWTLVNLRNEDIDENIFEIPCGFNLTSELGYTVGVRMNWSSTQVYNTFGIGNVSYMKLPLSLYDSYDATDTRRDVTCCPFLIQDGTHIVDGNTYSVAIEEPTSAPFGLLPGKWDVRKLYVHDAQWREQNNNSAAKWCYGIRPVRMRYAQVLLYYAELYNELSNQGVLPSGLPKTAVAAINEVRSRANASSLTATDYSSVFNAIVDENMKEFAGEGLRKWDLIRWNLLVYKTMEIKSKYYNNHDNGKYSTYFSWDYSTYGYEGQPSVTRPVRIENLCVYTPENYPSSDPRHDPEGRTHSPSEKVSGYGKGYNADPSKITYPDANSRLISSGLIGVMTEQELISNLLDYPSHISPESGVKNRYLMPLSNEIMNNSNHLLKNSYDYDK